MHPHHNNRLLVLLALLAAAGCGSESATKSPPGSTAADTTAPADKTEPGSQAGAPAQPAAGPANQPAARRPPAKPSPEQLARWALPDYAPLRLLACYDGFSDPAVHCLAVSPDGKQFVLGGAKLTLWNRQEPQPAVELLARYKPGDVERPIRSLAISADGKWLAAGDEKGMVRIWTLGDQEEVVGFQAHQGHITKLAFSPESRLLATTSFSGDVDLWQLPEGTKLKSLKMGQYELRHLAFLSETQLASAGSEPNIWNVETGAQETALTTKSVIGPALGLSSDRRLLAFSDADSGVQLWDVANSKPAGVALRGGGAALIAFSQDGKWIATYSGNSEIRVWDAAAGRLMQVIDADGGPTSALAWLPDCAALVVASVQGRVRIWGDPDAAATIGIEPIALPAPETTAAAAHRSLTSAEWQKVIDVRSFPRLPGAAAGWSEMGNCSYTAPASQQEAELFYRYALEQAGWTETTPAAAAAGLNFRKDGCDLSVYFSPSAERGSAGEAELQVSLHFAGNYDVRWLPKVSAIDSKNSYESPSHLMYRTRADLTDVEAALLKQFHEAGWTAYTRLAASGTEEPDSRTIAMLQRGSELTVSIGSPADAKGELVVSTSVHVSHKSLPIPPDSGWIEFDSSTDLQTVINTKMDLQHTIEFYDGRMAAEGWLAREAGRQIKDDRAWLPYIRGQQDVSLFLAVLDTGGTRVVVGDAASSSWQLKKPAVESAGKGGKREKSDKPGIEAADFRLPDGATAVKFDVDQKNIEFEVPGITPPKLGELFATRMESLEWKRDGAGIVGDDYTFITYVKAKAEIQLRARPKGKNTTAMISGDGLLWTKALPTAPVRISYETWLRRGGHQATLDRLDEFVAEMHKIPAHPPAK